MTKSLADNNNNNNNNNNNIKKVKIAGFLDKIKVTLIF
jgi:hypothetical protein